MLETNQSVNPSGIQETLVEGFKNEDYFNKSPLCRKIHALIECSDFVSDTAWIAERLGETESSIETALNVLVQMNLTVIKDGKIENKINQLSYFPQSKEFFVDCHKISSLEVLSGINTESRFAVYHGYQATDSETFWEFNERLQELQKWFREKSKNSKKDLLLGYTLTGANLLREIKGETNDQ